MNLLTCINRDLNADFDLSKFAHYAFFNLNQSRIEMHLISLVRQVISVAGQQFRLTEGESIHTENSYKFGIRDIDELCKRCGFQLIKVWRDTNNYFGISYLSVNPKSQLGLIH
ncbi:MAG: L-histidine N(alpha)-methyltransferase [Prochlorotrichaceae cyanobacterium]